MFRGAFAAFGDAGRRARVVLEHMPMDLRTEVALYMGRLGPAPCKVKVGYSDWAGFGFKGQPARPNVSSSSTNDGGLSQKCFDCICFSFQIKIS